MADLSNVTSGDFITSARQNDINDYIHWGTHWLNTQAIRIGGTEIVNSSRAINNVASITMSATISEFSTDVTLSDNSDSKVPTQKAVKTYVDSLVALTPENYTGSDCTGVEGPNRTLTVTSSPIFVAVDYMILHPTSSYTVVANTITFLISIFNSQLITVWV